MMPDKKVTSGNSSLTLMKLFDYIIIISRIIGAILRLSGAHFASFERDSIYFAGREKERRAE